MILFIKYVDAFNYRIGRFAMYGIFVMMGILLWSSISKTFFNPSLWTLEMAQFCMVAYYMLGGPYSIQMGSNVRMDLLYGEWDNHRKAQIDAITIIFLIIYLIFMIWGGWCSSHHMGLLSPGWMVATHDCTARRRTGGSW